MERFITWRFGLVHHCPLLVTFLSAWLMNCLAWSTSFLASSKEEEEEETKTAVVEADEGRRRRRVVFEELVEEEEGRKGVEEEKEVLVRVEEVIMGLSNLFLRPSWIGSGQRDRVVTRNNYPLLYN